MKANNLVPRPLPQRLDINNINNYSINYTYPLLSHDQHISSQVLSLLKTQMLDKMKSPQKLHPYAGDNLYSRQRTDVTAGRQKDAMVIDKLRTKVASYQKLLDKLFKLIEENQNSSNKREKRAEEISSVMEENKKKDETIQQLLAQSQQFYYQNQELLIYNDRLRNQCNHLSSQLSEMLEQQSSTQTQSTLDNHLQQENLQLKGKLAENRQLVKLSQSRMQEIQSLYRILLGKLEAQQKQRVIQGKEVAQLKEQLADYMEKYEQMKKTYEQEKKIIREADKMIDELEDLYRQLVQNNLKQAAKPGLTEKIVGLKDIKQGLRGSLNRMSSQIEDLDLRTSKQRGVRDSSSPLIIR